MQVKDRVREDDGDKQELVLTLVASADEVKEAADKFFAEIAQRDIPGFRKGKAPRAVLEQNVGGHKNAMAASPRCSSTKRPSRRLTMLT